MEDKTIKINKCQKHCLKSMLDQNTEVIHPPLVRRLRLQITRRFSNRQKKIILKHLDRYTDFLRTISGQGKVQPFTPANPMVVLKSGDLVRVHTRDEIEKTLDPRGQLKGCTFMQEMNPYCGTIHKVLKPVSYFMDERDNKVKKAKGIILLENVMCQGIKEFGSCDRSCHYFWRVEWLNKL